jgi:hypothetical protein
MKINCPVCQAAYDCDSRYHGKTFQCSRCGCVIAVPAPKNNIAPRQVPDAKGFPEKIHVAAADDSGTIYGALAAIVGFVWVIVFAVSSIAFFATGGAFLLGAAELKGGFFMALAVWAFFEIGVAFLFASVAAVFRIADCLCRLAGGTRIFGL